jgi:hypothetical protein
MPQPKSLTATSLKEARKKQKILTVALLVVALAGGMEK